jgi:hypothetical protein
VRRSSEHDADAWEIVFPEGVTSGRVITPTLTTGTIGSARSARSRRRERAAAPERDELIDGPHFVTP